MEYYISVIKEKILNSPSLISQMGWVAVAIVVVVVIAVLVAFGKNVRWKR